VPNPGKRFFVMAVTSSNQTLSYRWVAVEVWGNRHDDHGPKGFGVGSNPKKRRC